MSCWPNWLPTNVCTTAATRTQSHIRGHFYCGRLISLRYQSRPLVRTYDSLREIYASVRECYDSTRTHNWALQKIYDLTHTYHMPCGNLMSLEHRSRLLAGNLCLVAGNSWSDAPTTRPCKNSNQVTQKSLRLASRCRFRLPNKLFFAMNVE